MDQILTSLDQEFSRLDERARRFLAELNDAMLFASLPGIADTMSIATPGGYLLRSAAMVEQAFGGITTRLWDDPFEWTLPEKLNGKDSILCYLDEVKET